ncbi:hypothetical protein E2C01_085692 [Portunus trituberculatus]|uniref:Secreted protein n=1 Tax=Portunus trituberculatus TaxID=210409 RepID=A0A5B7J7J6_PORTR|nr:hypothetical protein [Portunus trituberculatus]
MFSLRICVLLPSHPWLSAFTGCISFVVRVRSTQEHISTRHTMAGGWRAPPDRETPAYSRPLLSPEFTVHHREASMHTNRALRHSTGVPRGGHNRPQEQEARLNNRACVSQSCLACPLLQTAHSRHALTLTKPARANTHMHIHTHS